MIPFLEAKHIVNGHISKLDVELLPLQECGGRILAENIVASFPSPQFNNSAMDGFAVRSEDTLGSSVDTPVRLNMVSIRKKRVEIIYFLFYQKYPKLMLI